MTSIFVYSGDKLNAHRSIPISFDGSTKWFPEEDSVCVPWEYGLIFQQECIVMYRFTNQFEDTNIQITSEN